MCISVYIRLKSLHDELYIIKDRSVLSQLSAIINTTLSFARRKRPKENNLPMKDKSLSPKKKPTRKQMGVSKKGLPVQKKGQKTLWCDCRYLQKEETYFH